MDGRRYNIGILTNGLENEFSSSVCRGAAELAEKMDFNLFIFPGNSRRQRINTVNENISNSQHATIFDYAGSAKLDAVIISFDKIFDDTGCAEADALRGRFGDIPVVTLNREEEGCGCVRYGSRAAGLDELVRHIIKYRGCKRIAMVGGQPGHPDAAERLEVFRRTLEENGIAPDESLIITGDFNGGAVNKIKRLLADPERRPEAVCCANDTLAAEVYEAAQALDIRIGEDLLVTGYDNSPKCCGLVPSLTTVNISHKELGVQAAMLAYEMIETRSPRTIQLDAVPVLRDSCGIQGSGSAGTLPKDHVKNLLMRFCAVMDVVTGSSQSRLLHAVGRLVEMLDSPDKGKFETDGMIELFVETVRGLSPGTDYGMGMCYITRMLTELISLSDIGDGDKSKLYALFAEINSMMSMQLISVCDGFGSRIQNNRFFINNIADFVDFEPNMCLGKMMHQLRRLELRNSWLFLTTETVRITDPTKAHTFSQVALKAYHRGSECFVPFENIKISSDALLSNEYVTGEQRGTFVTVPLYTMNEQLGLAVFDIMPYFMGYIPAIERQLSAALETLGLFAQINDRIVDVEQSNSVLRTIASEDALTGLLNRYGFFEHSENLARAPENAGREGLVAFVDMDNLKMTNDTFGHEAGDFALKLINRALVASFGTHSIIGRIGGDEFAVFTVPKEGEDEKTIRDKIHESLEQLNKTSGKPYNVSLSIGFTRLMCGERITMRSYLEKADEMLYDDKKHKPKSILKS